jgi:hypothetical protein
MRETFEMKKAKSLVQNLFASIFKFNPFVFLRESKKRIGKEEVG